VLNIGVEVACVKTSLENGLPEDPKLGVANLQGSLSQQLELVRKAASQIKDPAVQQRVLDAHKKVQKIYPRVLEASQAALRDPKTLSQSKAANAQLAEALASLVACVSSPEEIVIAHGDRDIDRLSSAVKKFLGNCTALLRVLQT